jgi:hypothetical protein
MTRQPIAVRPAPPRMLVIAGLSIALPLAASAQPNDVRYCQALLARYDTYIAKPAGDSPRRGGNATEIAAAKCREGDPAGIPGLEKALQNARIELPTRLP